MENVLDILKSRGLLDAVTSEELHMLTKKPLKVFCGFDPTSDSLHLGNMVAIMGLAWFQRCGHTPVALVGGATGMIGDPSGKKQERQLLDETTLACNLQGIQKNLETILLSSSAEMSRPLFVNNYDWFKDFSFLAFLRDVGKHFRIGTMLAKDSVKGRMESEEGMSFTEFSYQLLQAYDFYYLYSKYGVTVQIGGSDQWGNITAGIDYVRKIAAQSVYGVTFPLLTRSDGQKFGKTEKGAVWLSAEKLSPFECYQYLFRTPDADVIKLLKMLTFLPLGEIRELEHQMQSPGYMPNTAQKVLAGAIVDLLHGADGLKKALAATSGMAPGADPRKLGELDAGMFQELLKNIPTVSLDFAAVCDQKLIDIVVSAQFMESKGEVRRLIRNGGVWLNNKKVDDENCTVCQQDIIGGRFLLIALGKKHKAVVQVSHEIT